MSYTNILNNLTKVGEDKQALKKLIMTTLWDKDELGKFREFINLHKVFNGEKAQFIGDLEDIGVAGAGCDPTFAAAGITNSEKTWALGDWSVAIKLCYEQIKGSIAEYCMRKGTAVGDLTDVEFVNDVYLPAITKGLESFLWRVLWFGDTSAAHISDSGIIKNTIDVDLFKACDGFWKRLYTLLAINTGQLTAIGANSQSTYATQKSTMWASGYATGIMESLVMDAPIYVKDDPNAIVLMTRAMADALHHDIKVTYKSNLEWNTIFDGFDVAMWDGVKVARVNTWDLMIRKYEDTGTKLNKPYRALYINPANLAAGTNADDLLSDVDVWFNRDERSTKFYAEGLVGTLILDDNKLQAAY